MSAAFESQLPSPEAFLPDRPDEVGATPVQLGNAPHPAGPSFNDVPVDLNSLTSELEQLIQALRNGGLHYEPWQVATFVTASRTKPFLILAGISGTGKTKLPSRISRATSSRFELCPVKPDWTDSGELLGYTDLASKFQPGRLIEVIASADQNQDQHVFFCLDEMNLARVEFYLAEVLSVMEERSRGANGDVTSPPLVPNAPPVSDDGSEAVEYGAFGIPANMTLVGTVNMDETTHGFSKKVLDRAFVLELSDVDLSIVTQNVGLQGVEWPSEWWRAPSLTLAEDSRQGSDLSSSTIERLIALNKILAKAQLQFGYRLRDEVVLFVLNAEAVRASFRRSDGSDVDPFDVACLSKILPRIAGGGNRIDSILRDLDSFFGGDETAATSDDVTLSDGDSSDAGDLYPMSRRRVAIMRERLEDDGFASYWL